MTNTYQHKVKRFIELDYKYEPATDGTLFFGTTDYWNEHKHALREYCHLINFFEHFDRDYNDANNNNVDLNRGA